MSDDHIVRNSAPTLAGLKTGSMFTCAYETKEALTLAIQSINRRLGPKGLRMLPLRFSDRKALVYLYRPDMLNDDLSDQAAKLLLQHQGYNTESIEKCLVQLVRKLRMSEDFPHEIGLFLGYPPEDVWGFIELGPYSCKYTGCWKVYGDEDLTRKKFAQFKKCTQVYCDCFAKGSTIERLTVVSAVQ